MASTPKLNTEKHELLCEVVSKYLADHAEQLLLTSPDAWPSPLRAQVRDAVGEEFAATGFDAEYEPTPRGHMLESIIDFLNRLEIGSPHRSDPSAS